MVIYHLVDKMCGRPGQSGKLCRVGESQRKRHGVIMLRVRHVMGRAGLVAGLVVCAPAIAGAVTNLEAHRAVYAMSLVGSEDGSDISSVSGRLVLEAQGSTCEGFTTNQRIVNRMGSKQGSDFVSDFRVSSWESADGDSFTFSMVHYVNGALVEQIEGQADRSISGGKAQFSKPTSDSIALPAGVIFPAEQIIAMIDAARAGERLFAADVFDGSDTEHYFATTTFFGASAKGLPADEEAEPGASLEGLSYWPVRVSYFDPADSSGLPDFEVSLRLYENGVATGMEMDYGDLVIAARLLDLEQLPMTDC